MNNFLNNITKTLSLKSYKHSFLTDFNELTAKFEDHYKYKEDKRVFRKYSLERFKFSRDFSGG